jgi:hypothetical protein
LLREVRSGGRVQAQWVPKNQCSGHGVPNRQSGWAKDHRVRRLRAGRSRCRPAELLRAASRARDLRKSASHIKVCQKIGADNHESQGLTSVSPHPSHI